MVIVQLRNRTQTQMTGFFVKTDDGKIIAIDGGNKSDTEGFIENLEILTGSKTGKIDAWFMTHPHDDHYGVFETIVEKAGRGEDVPSCDLFGYYPKGEELGEDEKIFANQIVEFNETVKASPYKIHALEQNEKFQFGNLTIEVISVPSERIRPNAFNNASCVFKFTENRAPKKDFTMIFLGDLGVEGGFRLLDLCPNGIKADAVQMAHHGQNGVSREIYEAIHPRFAFYTTPDWLWYNTVDPNKPGEGPFKTLEVRKWMDEMGTIPVRACLKDVYFDTAYID